MPNGDAHEALIRQAYGAIGLDLSGTAMVEAHGKYFFREMSLFDFEHHIDSTPFRHRDKSWRSH